MLQQKGFNFDLEAKNAQTATLDSFWNIMQKLAALKTIFCVKGLWCTSPLLALHNSQLYITGAFVRPFWKNTEKFDVFKENLDVVSFFSVMSQIYGVYLRVYGLIRVFCCNIVKSGFHHRGFTSWVLQDKFRQFFGQFSVRHLCHLFVTKFQASVVVIEYFP